jgi:hypothetical protein
MACRCATCEAILFVCNRANNVTMCHSLTQVHQVMLTALIALDLHKTVVSAVLPLHCSFNLKFAKLDALSEIFDTVCCC